MTAQENLDLLKRLHAGDESAWEPLILQNMGLVRSVAKRFSDRGTEMEDLVQIGVVGLMRAARSFDFSYSTLFSTYAVPLIIGEIKRFLRDDGSVKVSRSIKTLGAQVLRQKEAFEKEKGREPTLSELSYISGHSGEEVITALEAIRPIHSLSEQIGDKDGSTLENYLADKENPIKSLCTKLFAP
jgi:RNA polymerase sporulation-specific sigma factor